MKLSNLVAIVTGGGKGIGKSYCERMSQEGAKVVVADIDYEAATSTVEQIKNNGGEALALKVDISDQSSVQNMVKQTIQHYGGIDILVNNASLMSVLPRRSWAKIPLEEWDQVMAVNLRGMFLCCLEAYPYMKDRGKGKIINISSGRFWEGTPNRLHYLTSKAGVLGFTRGLARELGDDNICVNAITPGLTASDTQVATTTGNYIDAVIEKRCFRRREVPEDLVGTVIFLASSDSDFITGQTINVDGGYSMH